METVESRIGFDSYFTVSSIGRRGGLVLLWKKDVPIEIMKFSNYHIHSNISKRGTGAKWCLTGFYGIVETSKRNGSWALLDRIKQTIVENWCVI